MRQVILTSKTAHGGRLLDQAGRPATWSVVREADEVGHSDRAGPWLHLCPITKSLGTDKSHDMWVHASEDRNFTVKPV